MANSTLNQWLESCPIFSDLPWQIRVFLPLCGLFAVAKLVKFLLRSFLWKPKKAPELWDYPKLQDLLRTNSVELPAMIVNMDQLNQNIQKLTDIAKKKGKKIRLATKSIRVPELIRHVVERGAPFISGFMCYSVHEAVFLHHKYGYDDFLIAYPCVQPREIQAAYQLSCQGVNLHLMVDSLEHVRIIDGVIHQEFGKSDTKPRQLVCIDFDVSYRPFGIHLGALRSPCRTFQAFLELYWAIQRSKHLQFASVMAYEAQMSIPDSSPFYSPLMGMAIPLLKRLSLRDVLAKRKAIVQFLTRHHAQLQYFNGGGTGTLHTTILDDSVTEVTVGSGFLQSQIFDYFTDHVTECALAYGLCVTRQPYPGISTCQSGGFMASGLGAPIAEPTLFLPPGMRKDPNEGFGEVQTPIHHGTGVKLAIGDLVLLRPAKAGEIAERFEEYILVEGTHVRSVPTYRGEGKTFY